MNQTSKIIESANALTILLIFSTISILHLFVLPIIFYFEKRIPFRNILFIYFVYCLISYFTNPYIKIFIILRLLTDIIIIIFMFIMKYIKNPSRFWQMVIFINYLLYMLVYTIRILKYIFTNYTITYICLSMSYSDVILTTILLIPTFLFLVLLSYLLSYTGVGLTRIDKQIDQVKVYQYANYKIK